MQRPESVSIDDIAPDSRKRYNKKMNSNEEKKEYRTPEFVYVEFAYSDVVVASSMEQPSGAVGPGGESL